MSEPHDAAAAARLSDSLRFACLSWTLIPIGWGLLFAAASGGVFEINPTLAALGVAAGANGVVTAIAGLVIAARAARRRHPGARGAIAFAIAGNAIALGTVAVAFAPLAFPGSQGGQLGDFGSPVRHPIADRPVSFADDLLQPGSDVVWSNRRPSAVAWHD